MFNSYLINGVKELKCCQEHWQISYQLRIRLKITVMIILTVTLRKKLTGLLLICF